MKTNNMTRTELTDSENANMVVLKMLEILRDGGWNVHTINDGEQSYDWCQALSRTALVDAMYWTGELTVAFVKAFDERIAVHRVLLIPENGLDVVTDYTYSMDGSDNFETCMTNLFARTLDKIGYQRVRYAGTLYGQ